MKAIFLCTLLSSFVLAQSFAQDLRVSSNNRYLETEDGKPFFWLGDTAWELIHKLNREDVTHYLETRAEQGFTVIQAVILAERDGVRTPNAYGDLPFHDLDPEKPNEAFFEHLDFIVKEANKNGLVMGLLPTWGDKVYSEHPGAGPILFGSEKARAFGQFLGERYADADLVWILGGDRLVANEEVKEVWNEMAAGIEDRDQGRHLITFHPRGYTSSSKFFHDSDWLDFNMYQSSHSQRYQVVYEFAQNDYNLEPTKPTIDGEPPYEDIPVQFWDYMKFQPGEFSEFVDEEGILVDRSPFEKGFFDAYDVRVHAYWNMLSGAAGYTYGNNAVWQMHEKGEVFVIPTLTDWRDALRRPGAEDMHHFRALFEQRDFSKLVPAQELILGENPSGSAHIRAAKSRDGDFAIIYFANPREVEIDVSALSGDQLNGYWYNPRTGMSDPIGWIEKEDVQKFTPPSTTPETDWVLVLDDSSANLGDPGIGSRVQSEK